MSNGNQMVEETLIKMASAKLRGLISSWSKGKRGNACSREKRSLGNINEGKEKMRCAARLTCTALRVQEEGQRRVGGREKAAEGE